MQSGTYPQKLSERCEAIPILNRAPLKPETHCSLIQPLVDSYHKLSFSIAPEKSEGDRHP